MPRYCVVYDATIGIYVDADNLEDAEAKADKLLLGEPVEAMGKILEEKLPDASPEFSVNQICEMTNVDTGESVTM